MLETYPLQPHVLGRHQMKVPSSFQLEHFALFVRQVHVEFLPAPASTAPEIAMANTLAARKAELVREADLNGLPTKWKFDEQPLPHGAMHLHSQGTVDIFGDLTTKRYLEVYRLAPGHLLRFRHEQTEEANSPPEYVAHLKRLREDFWTVVQSFSADAGPEAAERNPAWIHVPGGVLKLPYPRDRYESSDIEDSITISFADKQHALELSLEFVYPFVKEDVGILSGIVPAIARAFASIEVVRSATRRVDGSKGEELLVVERRPPVLNFLYKQAPSAATAEYRPRIEISMSGPVKRETEALEVWDAVLDTVTALVRAGQPGSRIARSVLPGIVPCPTEHSPPPPRRRHNEMHRARPGSSPLVRTVTRQAPGGGLPSPHGDPTCEARRPSGLRRSPLSHESELRLRFAGRVRLRRA